MILISSCIVRTNVSDKVHAKYFGVERGFFITLRPGGPSYRSRNWEESPGRIGHCTVESTDRR